MRMDYLFKSYNIYDIKDNKSIKYYKKYINTIKTYKCIDPKILNSFFKLNSLKKKVKKYHQIIYYQICLKLNNIHYVIINNNYLNLYNYTLKKLCYFDKLNLLMSNININIKNTKYILQFCDIKTIKISLNLIYHFNIYDINNLSDNKNIQQYCDYCKNDNLLKDYIVFISESLDYDIHDYCIMYYKKYKHNYIYLFR